MNSGAIVKELDTEPKEKHCNSFLVTFTSTVNKKK